MDYDDVDRIGLEDLTITEEYLIAPARLIVSLVKLVGHCENAKLGHVIVLPQTGKCFEKELLKCVPHNYTGNFLLLQTRRKCLKPAEHHTKEIWCKCQDYVKQKREFDDGIGTLPFPLKLLVHGGPGTNKSFLAQCIEQAASHYQYSLGFMAPTDIAASNDRTIHNVRLPQETR